ncbi:MAG: DUF5117 domain-containing protein, partial [Verrucomicrobia bacterium]|nr:DUF5117 domain-containing protein [Verrucomicrobiota bacterium]
MKTTSLIFLILFLSLGLITLAAQETETNESTPEEVVDEGAEDEAEEEEKEKTIEELTENSDLIEGLFTFYRDRKTGEVRLLLSEDDLDKEYLYFSYAENGPPESGWLTRGSYITYNAKLFVIRRFFDHIEFIEENTSFYFNPDKAISRAANANVSHSIFFEKKIESENEETGQILIKVDGLFLSESFIPIAPLPNPEKKPHEVFSMGDLSKDKSKIRTIKNYPENTDVRVEYVFENKKPYISGSSALTDPRFISVVIQHSLIAVPAEPMQPRFDDPRVGYFGQEVTDLSSTEAVPYRDMIKRWRLKKKDPDAALSEPVEPIVYWIENTTPVELRPIIEKAALTWNEAFEQAGFKNALQIKIQPDDAAWDAGDIRYNVLRWVSSPRPQYGGYGPSFLDPRSGEILGADVMLEHSVISRQIREGQTLGDPSLDAYHFQHNPEVCTAAFHAKNEFQFANFALEALGATTEENQRLLEEFIYFLTLHEIGHTLGLSHNFKSSYLHSLDDIYDPDKTYSKGL